MSSIRTERRGRVLTATIHNPPYNFLTVEIMDEWHELLVAAQDDDSIGAIVLRSDLEDIFISHFSVAELAETIDSIAELAVSRALSSGIIRVHGALEALPGARAALGLTAANRVSGLLRFHETCALMQRMDKVLIAAINGLALGGGSELALASDIRIMADGPYHIGQPEILIGTIPGGGGTQRLPRAIGAGRALELMLEGTPVTPREAEAIGYVHHVVPPAEFDEFVANTADRLARRPRGAVAAIKRSVNGDAALSKGLQAERSAFLTTLTSKSAREAMRVYLDHIDKIEASGATVDPDSLRAWIDGTAYDFTQTTPADVAPDREVPDQSGV